MWSKKKNNSRIGPQLKGGSKEERDQPKGRGRGRGRDRRERKERRIGKTTTAVVWNKRSPFHISKKS
jgi:hypothetical protein